MDEREPVIQCGVKMDSIMTKYESIAWLEEDLRSALDQAMSLVDDRDSLGDFPEHPAFEAVIRIEWKPK